MVSIDIEATGLNRDNRDEILQLALVDVEGNELSRYYSPEHHLSWKSAERVNHISPKDVLGKPKISDPRSINEIRSILRETNTILGWNIIGDLQLLLQAGAYADDIRCVDVMCDYGRWRATQRDEDARRWKLSVAAADFDVKLTPHDALEDARATMAVARCLLSRGWPLVVSSFDTLTRAMAGKYGIPSVSEIADGPPISTLDPLGKPWK